MRIIQTYFEQTRRPKANKKAVVRPLSSHPAKRQARHAENYWSCKDKLIGHFILWILTHGHTSSLCRLDAIYRTCLSVMVEWSGDREREKERERER